MANYLVYKDQPIVMHRGDHFKMPLFITDGMQGSFINPITQLIPTIEESKYTLKFGEKLYVGIMEPNKTFEESLIRKIYTRDDMNALGGITFELFSKDTENVVPGKYFIEGKLLDVDGEVHTTLPRQSFRIME